MEIAVTLHTGNGPVRSVYQTAAEAEGLVLSYLRDEKRFTVETDLEPADCRKRWPEILEAAVKQLGHEHVGPAGITELREEAERRTWDEVADGAGWKGWQIRMAYIEFVEQGRRMFALKEI